jgi:hypothetical protein
MIPLVCYKRLSSSLRDDKQFDNVRVAADRSKDHILHVLEFIRSQFPPKATVGNTSTFTWLFSFVSESKSYVSTVDIILEA